MSIRSVEAGCEARINNADQRGRTVQSSGKGDSEPMAETSRTVQNNVRARCGRKAALGRTSLT
jgi:hypothetical protein